MRLKNFAYIFNIFFLFLIIFYLILITFLIFSTKTFFQLDCLDARQRLMLILITELFLKQSKPTEHFQSNSLGFLIGLNASVCARNFTIFFLNTSNSMASTFLGLDRCERKLLGKFPSFFEKIQKIKCKIKGIPKSLWTRHGQNKKG